MIEGGIQTIVPGFVHLYVNVVEAVTPPLHLEGQLWVQLSEYPHLSQPTIFIIKTNIKNFDENSNV